MSQKYRKEVDTFLTQKGWELDRHKGAHLIYRHQKLGVMSVSHSPGHSGGVKTVERMVRKLERQAA
jgi:predicted RNA binding protein YcfA (HicA-like mRNA interferase family)